jgi:transcriptional regulator with XRE-family HTH domain
MFDIELLKATRILLDLSMEDVAKIMYVNKGTISLIEAGKCNKPSTMLLYQLVLEKLIKERSSSNK